MMQTHDGSIIAAYSWCGRKNVKFVALDENWIRGEKVGCAEELPV